MSIATTIRPARVLRPDPVPGTATDAGGHSFVRLTWVLIGIGIALRLTRWLLRYPLWHDEAFLAVNFIDRGWGDLLRPLDYLQVSPIGFLFLEQLAVRTFGFHEWSLRLVPMLAGIAALFVFQGLARRLLEPRAALLAIGVLAVSQPALRHANEVKPYSLDLLMAVVLLDLGARCLGRPGRPGLLAAFAVIAPIGLLLSMPAVFVAGGIFLALAAPVLRSGRRASIAALASFGLALVGGFGVLMIVSLRTPQNAILREFYLDDYWAASFPPFSEGLTAVAGWLVTIHAGNLFAYPIGGEAGASAMTFGCAIIGGIGLARGRAWPALLALLAPFGLTLVAAALRQYPYGGEARIAQHLAPAICLLAALGADRLIVRVRRPQVRLLLTRGLIAGLVVIGAAQFALSLVRPYQLDSSWRAREFARWFWPAMAADGPVACVKADLRRDFEPWQWVTGISAEYLCNQRIYRPHTDTPHRPPRGRPWRAVIYQVSAYGPIWDKPAFADWVDPLRQTYRLDQIRTYPVNQAFSLPDWKRESYHVLEFVPREANDGRGGPDALDELRTRFRR